MTAVRPRPAPPLAGGSPSWAILDPNEEGQFGTIAIQYKTLITRWQRSALCGNYGLQHRLTTAVRTEARSHPKQSVKLIAETI
jgi:hypothetical protein